MLCCLSTKPNGQSTCRRAAFGLHVAWSTAPLAKRSEHIAAQLRASAFGGHGDAAASTKPHLPPARGASAAKHETGCRDSYQQIGSIDFAQAMGDVHGGVDEAFHCAGIPVELARPDACARDLALGRTRLELSTGIVLRRSEKRSTTNCSMRESVINSRVRSIPPIGGSRCVLLALGRAVTPIQRERPIPLRREASAPSSWAPLTNGRQPAATLASKRPPASTASSRRPRMSTTAMLAVHAHRWGLGLPPCDCAFPTRRPS